jgi:hypothetical protein
VNFTRVLVACIVAAWPSSHAIAQTPIADRAGKLVSERLDPAGKFGAPGFLHEGPTGYEPLLPALPLTKFEQAAPRASIASPPRVVRPQGLAEETPLAFHKLDPARPAALTLAAGALLRLPKVDIDEPAPLPTLAQPRRERASLADPTVAASIRAALAEQVPMRRNAEPFTPLNLPRPFELRDAVRLRQAPAEDSTPQTR